MRVIKLSVLLVLAGGILAAAPDEPTGTITGVVKHSSAQRHTTLVYVEEIPGRKFEPPAAPPVVDQKGKVFLPAVLPVLVGSSVDFLNSDSFEHNVFSPEADYNLGNWGQGERRSYTFKQAGVYTQLCKLHPEMMSYVVVVKTPYFALADSSGQFVIPGVPVGSWKLKVWNERLKSKQLGQSFPVTVSSGGQAAVDITF